MLSSSLSLTRYSWRTLVACVALSELEATDSSKLTLRNIFFITVDCINLLPQNLPNYYIRNVCIFTFSRILLTSATKWNTEIYLCMLKHYIKEVMYVEIKIYFFIAGELVDCAGLQVYVSTYDLLFILLHFLTRQKVPAPSLNFFAFSVNVMQSEYITPRV